MKKNFKVLTAIALAAALMTGSAVVSMAATSPSSPSGSANVASTFTGWVSETEGKNTVWRYYQKGEMMENEWLQSGQSWYYLGDGGAMVTGFEELDEITYYFSTSGSMATGWVKLANSNSGSSGPAGSSKTSTNGWYYFDTTGAMTEGWKYMNSNWYYFADDAVSTGGFSDGQMLYGEVTINDAEYYFGTADEGIMKTGLVKVLETTTKSGPTGNTSTTKYCYYNTDGQKKVSSWLVDNGKWYYFDDEGLMVTGKLATNNKGEYVDYNDVDAKHYYYMDDSTGAMKTGWVQIKGDSIKANSPTASDSSSSYYQYYNTDGSMHTGWLSLSGKWYYFANKEDIVSSAFSGYVYGQMAVGDKSLDDAGTYKNFYFNTNGVMAESTWKEIDSSWYYFGTNGVRYEANAADDLLVTKISSKYYVINQNGVMLQNTTVYKVNNKWTQTQPTTPGTYSTYVCAKSTGVATAGTKTIQ